MLSTWAPKLGHSCIPPPTLSQLQAQIDALTATVAAQAAAVTALTTKLDSCGACNHLDVTNNAGASNCEVKCKYGTANAASLFLEY